MVLLPCVVFGEILLDLPYIVCIFGVVTLCLSLMMWRLLVLVRYCAVDLGLWFSCLSLVPLIGWSPLYF